MTTPAPAPIALPSVTDAVYSQLRHDISRGIYPPGPLRLKPIAERFAVSVVPVREALRRLEAEGLVSFDGKRRIMINSLNEHELDEIFAIRGELESLALRRAIHHLMSNPDALARLEDLIERMDAQERQPNSWRDSNRDFHFALYEAGGAPRLLSIITSLWVATTVSAHLCHRNAKSSLSPKPTSRDPAPHSRRRLTARRGHPTTAPRRHMGSCADADSRRGVEFRAKSLTRILGCRGMGQLAALGRLWRRTPWIKTARWRRDAVAVRAGDALSPVVGYRPAREPADRGHRGCAGTD